MNEPAMFILGGRRERRGPGRPALYGARAKKRIEIVVTDEQRRDLDQVAADQGKPLATVIREAVNEYVADYREQSVFTRSSRNRRK